MKTGQADGYISFSSTVSNANAERMPQHVRVGHAVVEQLLVLTLSFLSLRLWPAGMGHLERSEDGRLGGRGNAHKYTTNSEQKVAGMVLYGGFPPNPLSSQRSIILCPVPFWGYLTI